MRYQRPEYTTMTRLPNVGRSVNYRVEGFLSKEEAQQYADYFCEANWGYGPSARVSESETGTWTVDINLMDSCD